MDNKRFAGLEQMDDNLTCMGNFQPLSEQEMDVIRQAQETLSEDRGFLKKLKAAVTKRGALDIQTRTQQNANILGSRFRT